MDLLNSVIVLSLREVIKYAGVTKPMLHCTIVISEMVIYKKLGKLRQFVVSKIFPKYRKIPFSIFYAVTKIALSLPVFGG